MHGLHALSKINKFTQITLFKNAFVIFILDMTVDKINDVV